VIEIGSRRRNQPAPPHAVFEAVTNPDRDPYRPWLKLLYDETRPQTVRAEPPSRLVWTSIWIKRPDAIIESDLPSDGGGGTDFGGRSSSTTRRCSTATCDSASGNRPPKNEDTGRAELPLLARCAATYLRARGTAGVGLSPKVSATLDVFRAGDSQISASRPVNSAIVRPIAQACLGGPS
jgi:hypothetical protein